MYKIGTTALSLIALSLFLMGCQSPKVGIRNTVSNLEGQYSQHVQPLDLRLAKQLSITVQAVEHANNLLTTTFQFQNLTSSPKRFNYRVSWVDQNGVDINSDGEPWVPLNLIGHQIRAVKEVAPNPRATSFLISVMRQP